MKIFITDENKIASVTLRAWMVSGWGVDEFDTLEVDAPRLHPVADDRDGCDAEMTRPEFDELVEWWTREVEAYNSGKDSYFTEGMSYDEKRINYASREAYALIVAEEDA